MSRLRGEHDFPQGTSGDAHFDFFFLKLPCFVRVKLKQAGGSVGPSGALKKRAWKNRERGSDMVGRKAKRRDEEEASGYSVHSAQKPCRPNTGAGSSARELWPPAAAALQLTLNRVLKKRIK